MPNLVARFFEHKINGAKIVSLLAQLLSVKITFNSIKRDLEEHPDYPSLLSISDVLANYGIENLTVKITSAKLANVPVPFITQLKKDDAFEYFTVIKEIKSDVITYFDLEKEIWATTAIDKFIPVFSGIVLLAEAGENSGESDYKAKLKQEKQQKRLQQFTIYSSPFVIVAFSCITIVQQGVNALLPILFALFTLTGLIISILLLLYEIDQYNPLIRQICSAVKNSNCGTILQSSAAKIAGISWSSIGFTYFAGSIFWLLIVGVTNIQLLATLAWINVLAVPYVFYSLYFQWKVAKQWCILCLLVQATLVLQLSVALFAGWHKQLVLNSITPGTFLSMIMAYSVPFIVINILMPALLKAREKKKLSTDLSRLKHDPVIFDALLRKQRSAEERAEGLGILLGNPNAAYKIIKVCNLYCGPCAAVHKTMEQLLHNNDDLRIQIIFTATNREGDKMAAPVKHLLAIDNDNQKETTQKALDDWYSGDKDYSEFAARYPMDGQLKKQDLKIDEMADWCAKVEIKYTPTFFISTPNQPTTYFELPQMYRVSDLKYFLSK